jgi:flagellar basal body-associated protein FliL
MLPIAVVLALLLGIGGTFGVMHFLMPAPKADASKPAPPPPPKPIFFAEIPDVVVSIPPEAGQPASSYVQLGVQFSTYDEKALTTFAELQPIIKASIINLMLNETSAGLQTPAGRADIVKNCQNIANTVMNNSANYTPANPFFGAYITNLVIQD